LNARLFALVVVACVAGCGSRGSATGTVTLDGTPLKEGLITFHPVEPGPTAYGQVKEGEFTVSTGQKTGLQAGKYKVTVSASTIPEPGSTKEAKLLTPAKYSRPETSGLEAAVGSGSNRFKFEMKSK
jgi:hypothetical protein